MLPQISQMKTTTGGREINTPFHIQGSTGMNSGSLTSFTNEPTSTILNTKTTGILINVFSKPWNRPSGNRVTQKRNILVLTSFIPKDL